MAKASSKTARSAATKPAVGMTFAQFGENFFHLAITQDVIAQNLAAAVATPITIDEVKPKVTGTGKAQIGRITTPSSGDPASEMIFEVPILIHLTLYVQLADLGIVKPQENYEIAAETTLRLFVHAIAPLTVQIDVPALKTEDVALTVEGKGNWADVARIRIPWANEHPLDEQIQERIASQINDAVAASAPDRTIDVLDKVRQALAAGGAPDPKADAGKPAAKKDPSLVLVRGAEPVSATLAPEQTARFALPAGETDAIEVSVYTRKADRKAPDGELMVDVLDAEGGKLRSWLVWATASGEDWDHDKTTVFGSELGDGAQAFLRLRNATLDEGKTPKIEYKLKIA